MTPTPPPMPGAMSIPQPPPPGVPAAPAAYGSPGPAAAPGICRNHPNIPTNQICQWCRNSYCSQCLVDFRGSNLCAWCKQAAVVQMQRQANSCDPRTVMLWARIYNIVMVLGCLAMLGLQFFAYGNTRFGFYSEPMWLAWRYVPAGIGLLMALPPAIGLGQGRRWTYLWEMIILIPSMLLSCFWASCLGIVFWPCAIVLLVFWVRPEVKDFFETPA
jgi:hypothetical protein